jgi:hypothetical protein
LGKKKPEKIANAEIKRRFLFEQAKKKSDFLKNPISFELPFICGR